MTALPYVPFTKYHETPPTKTVTEGEPTELERHWMGKKVDASWLMLHGCGIVRALLSQKEYVWLSLIVRTALWGMVEKAQDGDREAQRQLMNSLWEPLGSLFEAASRQPEKFQHEAEKMTGWPLVFTPHPEYQKRYNELLKTLGVGSKSTLKMRGKTRNRLWSLETPAARWAYQALQIVTVNRDSFTSIEINAEANKQKLPQWVMDAAKLPELSVRTAPKWLAVCWDAILEAFPKIENDADWKNIKGRFRNGAPKPSELRGKIYDSIRQAFMVLISLR